MLWLSKSTYLFISLITSLLPICDLLRVLLIYTQVYPGGLQLIEHCGITIALVRHLCMTAVFIHSLCSKVFVGSTDMQFTELQCITVTVTLHDIQLHIAW
jgi:hypothetical protein